MSALDTSAGVAAHATGNQPRVANVEPTNKRALVGAFVVLALLGTCLYSPQVLEQLLLGWIYFPLRVAPLVTVDWATVWVGAIFILAFLIGLHVALRWLAICIAKRTPDAPQIGFRTSLAIGTAILLLFTSGTAIVGMTHQAVWLITGRTTRSAGQGPAAPVYGLITNLRSTARRSQQKNNLKQIGLGFHTFHDTCKSLPPGGTIDDHGRLMHGWAIYLGNYASYSSSGIDFSRPWNEPPNDRLYRCALPDFINPSISEVFDKDGYGLSHVAGNVHVLPITRVPRSEAHSPYFEFMALADRDTADRSDKPLRLDDIRDGTSNTILIGEAAGNFRPWGHPANVRDPALGVGKNFEGFGGPAGAGGAQFLMVDGSVRFISNEVDPKVISALGTPAGGKIFDAESVSGPGGDSARPN